MPFREFAEFAVGIALDAVNDPNYRIWFYDIDHEDDCRETADKDDESDVDGSDELDEFLATFRKNKQI